MRIFIELSKRSFQRFLTYRAATLAGLLTTHDLSDVEELCRWNMIIDQGQLLFDGALDNIRDRFGKDRELVVDFADAYDDVQLEGAELISHDGPHAAYRFNRTEVSASVLINRLSADYRITDLAVVEPEIEALVRRIYEERLLDNRREDS